MSLRGLDEFITGRWGEDYWNGYEEHEHTFVCGFCRSGACAWCLGKQCNCPNRYGRTAPEHGPYQGPVKLVMDNKSTAESADQQPVGEVIPETRQTGMQPPAGEAVTLPRQGNNNSAPDTKSHNSFRRTDMVQPQTRATPAEPQALGLQIRKAERKQAKLRLALSGPSGSGKTYSALLIAFGLGGKRIGMIDTERGSGELYSHIGDYDIIALDPPYTVSRYLEAMNMFEVAGYDTIIIDSITHEWAGEGGLLRAKEQIDAKAGAAGDKYNPFASWAKITPHHDRFIAAMLGSPCHLIATMRSKMTYVQEGSSIKKRGVEPVQRDQIEYEFTVVLDINAEHIAVASKDRTELFGGWMEQITPRVGQRLLDWLNNAPPMASQPHSDSQLEARREERAVTTSGSGTSADIKNGAPAEHFYKTMPGVEVSVRDDEADGKPGVSEPVGREALDALAVGQNEPADAAGIERISKLLNATVKRLKAAGDADAYKKASAIVNKLTHDEGIPGLLQNQLEECTKALQSL